MLKFYEIGYILGRELYLFFLKNDQVIKAIWCVIRLRSGKWIKKIKSSSEFEEK